MRPLLVSAVSLFVGSSLIAQTTGPIDAKSMLASLQDIKQKQEKSAKSQLTQTISDFTAASADDSAALDFYTEAVRVTRFVGQPHEDTAFHDWKKTELAKLNPSAIRTALRYTTLSLQRAAGATDEQIFPVLLAYAEDTEAILPSYSAPAAGRHGGGNEAGIIQQSVADNIFTKWYNIGGELSGLENWELVPGNIDGMYEKVLLPVMRKKRDPRILRYWDDKIIAERGKASMETAAFNTDRFNLTRRPTLLWSRAEDEVVIGMRDQGITEMFNLVKAFPGHPDAGKWIPELETLLAATPAATPASAPTRVMGGSVPYPAAPSATPIPGM